VLQRVAFSPYIKEGADCFAALLTAGGKMLVQAEHIPGHLGSMPASFLAVTDVRHEYPAGRPGRAQRPVRGRDPSQQHHARGAVASSVSAPWSH
jgi:Hydantoinase B/oxoprolinase